MSGPRPACSSRNARVHPSKIIMTERGGEVDGRLQHAVRFVPLGTQALVALNVSAFIVLQVAGVSLSSVSLAPGPTALQLEVYRLVSNAFTHEGVFHLLFNMLSLVAWGATVERLCGTIRFVFLNLASVLLGSCLYVAAAFAFAALAGRPTWLSGGAVGYSGVLFTLAVIESHVATASATRSVCGILEIPRRVYPFVLLFLLALVPG